MRTDIRTASVAVAALAAILLPMSASRAAPSSAIAAFALGEGRPQPGWPGIPVAAGSDATLGWSFTVDVPVDVVSLGFYDLRGDGLNEPHLVGIWDSQGVLVVSAQINEGSANPLVNLYRYSVVQPRRLVPGQTYVVGATVPLGEFVVRLPGHSDALSMDLYPYHNVVLDTIVLDSHVFLDANALRYPGSAGPNGTPGPGELHLPTERHADGYYFAPNFQFHAVPEPHTLVLLAACAAPALFRRVHQ